MEVFVYRLGHGGKDLRFRYINNTAAMWLVFMAFNFMITFVKRNNAAHFRIKPVYYLLPVHAIYMGMLFLGFNKDFGAFCHNDSYPHIFVLQYSIFFLTYIFYMFHHYNGHFIKWDDKALGPEIIEDEK